MKMWNSHDNCIYEGILKRTLLNLSVLICGLAVAGCQTTSNYDSLEPSTIPTREMDMDYEYRLEVGDKLSLKFFYNHELNDEVLVGPDGNASLLLVGNLSMAGQTVSELDETLTKLYDAHVAIPEVTVALVSVASQRVYIGGEVMRPGVLEAEGGLTLKQAIFMAGGYKSSGKISSVVVMRDNGDPVLDYYIIDIGDDLSTLEGIQDFRLRGRDIVYIPKSKVGSMNQFLNLHLKGLKEVFGLFNFTVTYELRDRIDLSN